MKVTASALSLNVDDPLASAAFAEEKLGFTREMSAEGFISLSREDTGFNLIYLRTGLDSFKPDWMRGQGADGVLVVLVVDDVDAEYERLADQGTAIATPIQTEPWGERFFQIVDPNGVVIQLVQWIAEPAG